MHRAGLCPSIRFNVFSVLRGSLCVLDFLLCNFEQTFEIAADHDTPLLHPDAAETGANYFPFSGHMYQCRSFLLPDHLIMSEAASAMARLHLSGMFAVLHLYSFLSTYIITLRWRPSHPRLFSSLVYGAPDVTAWPLIPQRTWNASVNVWKS